MDRKDLTKQHPPVSKGEDFRITNIILKHWEKVRGTKMIPCEKDLDPNVLEPLLDNCFLINITKLHVDGQYTYVYIGKNIVDAYGSKSIDAKKYYNVNLLPHKTHIEAVVNVKKPVVSEGEFINQKEQIVKYRQCFVPLGKDGSTIDSIFGGMRFKIFKPMDASQKVEQQTAAPVQAESVQQPVVQAAPVVAVPQESPALAQPVAAQVQLATPPPPNKPAPPQQAASPVQPESTQQPVVQAQSVVVVPQGSLTPPKPVAAQVQPASPPPPPKKTAPLQQTSVQNQPAPPPPPKKQV